MHINQRKKYYYMNQHVMYMNFRTEQILKFIPGNLILAPKDKSLQLYAGKL